MAISSISSGLNSPLTKPKDPKDQGVVDKPNQTDKKDETSTNTSNGLNKGTNANANNSTNSNNQLNQGTNNNSSGSGTTSSGSGTSGSTSGSGTSGGTSSTGKNEESTGPTDNPSHKPAEKKDPNSLDKDAFLRLFLEQLKAQDPTAPMETNQILEQSAMMTQIEQQQEMKKTLESMTESIKTMSESSKALAELQGSMSKVLTDLSTNIGANSEVTSMLAQLSTLNSSGVVGKIAETSIGAITITSDIKGQKRTFDIWFDDEINLDPANGGNKKAKVIIKDKDGATIREFPLDSYKDTNGNPVDVNGKKGYLSFEWDARDKSGNVVNEGDYTVVAEYNFESDGKTPKQTRIGRGEVLGVAFVSGVPMLKLGPSNDITYNMFFATSISNKTA